MPRTRKSHPPSLKAKVAVEAIKAHKCGVKQIPMSTGPVSVSLSTADRVPLTKSSDCRPLAVGSEDLGSR